MPKFIPLLAAVSLVSVESSAYASEYPGVADFRTYCMTYHANSAEIAAAAQASGWMLSEHNATETTLVKTYGENQRSILLAEGTKGGEDVRSCATELKLEPADARRVVHGLLQREPTSSVPGRETWVFIYEDGKYVPVSDRADSANAKKLGEAVVIIGSTTSGPVTVLSYMEMRGAKSR